MVIKFIGKPTLTQIIATAAICLFLFTNAMQYRSNRGYKDTIKTNAKEIKQLKKAKEDILKVNVILKEEKEAVLKQADSFKLKEKYYKNKYYVTDKKLKKILADYDGADDDTQDDLFSDAVNN